MLKFLNVLMILIIFILSILKFYSSNKNISMKNFNRSNIDTILQNKINDLPTLANDTNNVIEFNDSFETEINNNKKRSFWDLLKD